MNTTDYIKMSKNTKKSLRRLLSFLIVTALAAGLFPPLFPITAYAMVQASFYVEIDSAISGNILVTLTDAADSADTKTESVSSGVAEFSNFVDLDKTYHIAITGMHGYNDYNDSSVQLSGTKISFTAADFNPVSTFSITTSAGTNGTVTSSETSISYGENRSITAEAEPEYLIEAFIVDGTPVTEAEGLVTYTHVFDNITEDHTVDVSFAKKPWQIAFTFNQDGVIKDGDSNQIASDGFMIAKDGESPAFTAEANTGYYISSVIIDSTEMTDGTFDEAQMVYSYVFANISEDHSVTVVFSANTYNIDITVSGNGIIKNGDVPADSPQSVNHGETLTLDLIPDEGCDVDEILLDGVQSNTYDLSADDKSYTYVLSNVSADHSLSVVFAPIKTITGDEDQFYEVTGAGLISGYPATSGDKRIYNFMNDGSEVNLSAKNPYERIKINEYESVTSVPLTGSILISKIEVYKSSHPDKGWRTVSTEKPIQIIIDRVAPVLADIPPMDWTNKDYSINGTVTDENTETAPSSGLSRVVWSKAPLSNTQVLAEAVNTVPVTDGAYSIPVTEEQDNATFYVYAVDKAGNVSDAKTVLIKVDKTKPVISEFLFQKTENSPITGVINFFKYGTFYHDDIEVIITAQDSGISSGLKEITLYKDGVAAGTEEVIGGSATFQLSLVEFSDNEISASATDIAGNESAGKTKPTMVKTNAQSNKVSLKLEKPEISIVPVNEAPYMDGEKGWYDGDEELTVKVSTESAGLYSIAIKINDQLITADQNGKAINANFFETQTLEELFIVSTDVCSLEGENIIEVIAINNYGNEESLSKKIYIDRTNPEVTGFYMSKENDDILSKIFNFLSFGNFFNEKVKITVKADDGYELGCGIATITLYANGEVINGLPAAAMVMDDGGYKAEFLLPEEIIPDIKLLDAVLSAVATDNLGHITGQNIDNPEGIPVTPMSVNSDLKSNSLMVETVRPEVDIVSPDAFYTDSSSKKWFYEDVLFGITARDVDSGIRSVRITINGVEIPTDMDGKVINANFYETETHEESFAIHTSQGIRAADGAYLIEVTVIDNAGNAITASDIVYKDIDNPYIAEYQFIPTAAEGIGETTEFIEYLEYGFYFKAEAAAVIKVIDPGPSSGLDQMNYRLVSYQDGEISGETSGTQKMEGDTLTLTIPKGFKGQIYAEASDNTIHVSDEETPRAMILDETPPKIDIAYNSATNYHDADGNKLYVSDMSLTVSVTDEISGIREIGYSQSAEKQSFEKKSILLENTGNSVGKHLGDGWMVMEMDVNLVTKVTKTFTFETDDNNILLTFDATDRSGNMESNIQTEKMTIDTTPPVISVVFREDESKNGYYYHANRIADIKVIERNFDSSLIKAEIVNDFGSVPDIEFTSSSLTEHVGVIDFGEGDYTFDLAGTDLGNQMATVEFGGGNEKTFYVDKTAPVVEDNFGSFSKPETKDSFNTDQTVSIKVIEHNFSPDLMNVSIKRKEPGEQHTIEGLYDATWEAGGQTEWESSGDVHTMTFTLSEDGIYQIEIAPSDLAENNSDTKSTVIFEIDKTPPIVWGRNDMPVKEEDTEFLDIYPYTRKDDPVPTVEFQDVNIDHIKYNLSVFIPENIGAEEGTVIRPTRVYSAKDQEKSGIIKGNRFTLPGFTQDGVYSLELTAVDVAGNESLLNVNTYARMIDQDVLAYIMGSNPDKKTGIYSFQYENGEPISKRPDNFSDITIQVLAKKGSNIDVVLRDNNADEINTNTQAEADDSIYGVGIYNCVLKADFFKEKFQGDTDTELRLAVNNEGKRIDLGLMHIDNIAPECILPEKFKSWSWFYGEEERVITISDISELIDENQCSVYDNGREVPFAYSSDKNTLVFTLEKGWHNVGIILDDVAGNANNIQEKENIHIGYFWLWVMIAMSVVFVLTAVVAAFYHIRKKQRLENDF